MFSVSLEGPWAARASHLYRYAPSSSLMPATLFPPSPVISSVWFSGLASFKRPISPAVTIYNLPLPACSSIGNRIAAVGLTVALALVYFRGPRDKRDCISQWTDRHPILGGLFRGAVTGGIFYHFLDALRHLGQFSQGKGMTILTANRSSKAMFGISGAAAIYAMFSRGGPRQLSDRELKVVPPSKPGGAAHEKAIVLESVQKITEEVQKLEPGDLKSAARLQPIVDHLREL